MTWEATSSTACGLDVVSSISTNIVRIQEMMPAVEAAPLPMPSAGPRLPQIASSRGSLTGAMVREKQTFYRKFFTSMMFDSANSFCT